MIFPKLKSLISFLSFYENGTIVVVHSVRLYVLQSVLANDYNDRLAVVRGRAGARCCLQFSLSEERGLFSNIFPQNMKLVSTTTTGEEFLTITHTAGSIFHALDIVPSKLEITVHLLGTRYHRECEMDFNLLLQFFRDTFACERLNIVLVGPEMHEGSDPKGYTRIEKAAVKAAIEGQVTDELIIKVIYLGHNVIFSGVPCVHQKRTFTYSRNSRQILLCLTTFSFCMETLNGNPQHRECRVSSST